MHEGSRYVTCRVRSLARTVGRAPAPRRADDGEMKRLMLDYYEASELRDGEFGVLYVVVDGAPATSYLYCVVRPADPHATACTSGNSLIALRR